MFGGGGSRRGGQKGRKRWGSGVGGGRGRVNRYMDEGVLVKGDRFQRARFMIVENRNRKTCGAQTKLPIMTMNDTLTQTGKNDVVDYFLTFMYFMKTVGIKRRNASLSCSLDAWVTVPTVYPTHH